MSVAPQTELRRTPLYERHRAAGARLVAFAGWEMPIQYGGIREEHLAVRRAAGVFDVSHMGQIQTRGPQGLDFLQYVTSNDLRRLAEGGAQYGLICREDGGVLDDLFTYRLAESSFLTVTNAANHEQDLAWFRAHAEGFEVDLIDRSQDYSMLAVQGPQAQAIVAGLADGPLPARMHCSEPVIAGAPALVCATGYTGEDGYELLLDPTDAGDVWDALLSAGVAPVGLGARDTLRLEVCYHLHGNDLSVERNPIEAGLGWACQEETGFVGSEAVATARRTGSPQRLVAFVLDADQGIARAGNPILGGGLVTSGTFSPCLGHGIGMAYVPAESAEPGTRIEIDVRGKTRTARIEQKPLYRKGTTGCSGQ